MIDFGEMILMGLFATYFMDFCAKFLIKLKVVRPTVESNIPGRWILYMLRGKFSHDDIHLTPPLNYEKHAAQISHYLIGITLIGAYLFLELQLPAIRDVLWTPLVFGFATVILPWFWLYPSIGIGFLASKSPNQLNFIILSCINHTNFGVGMLIWILALRQFVI